MKTYGPVCEETRNVIMNSADDKGLTEGIASIFFLSQLYREGLNISNNKKWIYFYFFRWPSALSVCHHDEQILSHSNFTPHTRCESLFVLKISSNHKKKERIRWKGIKCRSSWKVISDKKSLSGFVSATFIFTVDICFRLSIEQSCLNLFQPNPPSVEVK